MNWLSACFEDDWMTPNKNILALAAAAILLSSAPAAHATLAAAATFDEKVENAASIVVGKCVKSESRLDPSGKWILTYSTFQIADAFKGQAGGQVTVVTPGGQVGSTRQETIGIPEFREGDEHVLFLKNSRLGPTVLYFDQGAYDVKTDDRGDKIVAPVATTLVKIDTQRGMAAADESPRSLRAFKAEVTASMRDSRQRKMLYDVLQTQRRRQEASIGSVLLRYRFWIAIAALGAAIATWQLLRR